MSRDLAGKRRFNEMATSRQLAWFSSGLTNREQLYVGRGPGATSQ
jgi:hypothetical protein